MAFCDPMELASPFNSTPCTPKPGSRKLDALSPPYKSNATVISLGSSPLRNYDTYDIEDHMRDYLSHQQQQYNDDNNSDATQIPDLTEYTQPYEPPARKSQKNITPLKLSRPRTFARHPPGYEDNITQTLDCMVLSPPAPNPPITVILVLTPRPASIAETEAFGALGTHFCNDFGSAEWSCISLYAHFRKWAANDLDPRTASSDRGKSDEDHVGIGSIHPYALRAKLDQEKEVQWRLAIPVLRALIDKEVRKGLRTLVVCGMSIGDVEGVRAFGRVIAEPSGIFAFLPATPLTMQAVPMEYSNRCLAIDSMSYPQNYDALLAALYAKSLSLGKASKAMTSAGEESGGNRSDGVQGSFAKDLL